MVTSRDVRATNRAFTLIELVVVIVVLAILSGAAIVRYYDVAPKARAAADGGALAGLNEALNQRYLANRMNAAATSSWITSPTQVATVMHWDNLPHGITITGNQFVDQRGNAYAFTAETASQPARIAFAAGASGSGAASSGSGGTPALTDSSGSGSSGGSNGAGSIPASAALLIVVAPWLSRSRRGDPA
jgi:prepilin-type N-terminal cleavage/methylation domain-containing protein